LSLRRILAGDPERCHCATFFISTAKHSSALTNIHCWTIARISWSVTLFRQWNKDARSFRQWADWHLVPGSLGRRVDVPVGVPFPSTWSRLSTYIFCNSHMKPLHAFKLQSFPTKLTHPKSLHLPLLVAGDYQILGSPSCLSSLRKSSLADVCVKGCDIRLTLPAITTGSPE
jgi:hypothetical protein